MTNFMADLVGSLTGSPEVTLLCIGNMASICVDFVYQITFFTAIMAIAGKFEMEEKRIGLKHQKVSIQIGSAELKATNFIDVFPQKVSESSKKPVFADFAAL
jgi:hypothetical protein